MILKFTVAPLRERELKHFGRKLQAGKIVAPLRERELKHINRITLVVRIRRSLTGA